MNITYKIFGRYGWFRHGIPRAIRAFVFRMRHGFDFRDCWSLDMAMAKWLAPRLRYMSEIAHGAPCGYPDKEPSFEAETDFEAWRDHLLLASVLLEDYANMDDMEPWNIDRENAVRESGQRAIEWVAKNFQSLWD